MIIVYTCIPGVGRQELGVMLDARSVLVEGVGAMDVVGSNLNRNLGKYQLPHIWGHLLHASPTLQCKPSSLPVPPTPPT